MSKTSQDEHDVVQAVSDLARSMHLTEVTTPLVDFAVGNLPPIEGSFTSSLWFTAEEVRGELHVTAHVQIDAPGGADGKPRFDTELTPEDVIFTAHVHALGVWKFRGSDRLPEHLQNSEVIEGFAQSSGRLNLYPYLRATVSRLCSDAGMGSVPPLPPMLFDIPPIDR